MVLANAAVTRMMREFCARQDFAAIFRVTEEQRQNQTDLEYAVRLMVHTATDLSRRTDVQEFLDRAILDILTSDEAEEWVNAASWVVAELHRLLGENALIPPDERLAGIAPRFSLRALEGIAVGIGRNRAAIMQLPDRDAFIRDRVASFWLQPEVAEMSAAGLRGTVRLQRSIPFGTRWFNPDA